jgi:hypothetical protein
VKDLHSAVSAVVNPQVKLQFQKLMPGNCAVPPALLTNFLVSTYISVLTWWLKSQNPVPPEEIHLAYQQLVLPCLASIFG